MSVIIEVNNKSLQVRKGDTILEALEKNGLQIPTLCNMKGFSPTGACRMCVVEVDGEENLITACSYPIKEWMKIKTHSPRIIRARKTNLELLLANHPDDCLYCIRNKSCELQNLANELDIKERRFIGKKNKPRIDKSAFGIVREPAKCILCGRCVRVCEEKQSVSAIEFIGRGKHTHINTALSKSMSLSCCIECGQCIMVCPTGALRENDAINEVLAALHDSRKQVYVQYDPSLSVTLGEVYGIKEGKDFSGKLNAALRKIGFKKVIQSSLGADISIMHTVDEFITRKENNQFPLITSNCPSWVKYVEFFKPDYIPFLSKVKSLQQITGTLIKNYLADKDSISREKCYNVSIMPCIARKQEANKESLSGNMEFDVDSVVTTREIIKLIDLCGIGFENLDEEPADLPSDIQSSSGILSAVAGGFTEAFIRTLYKKITGKELDNLKIDSLRDTGNIKKYKLRIGEEEFVFVAISGITNALQFLDEIERYSQTVHFIEIMACEYGCVAGGGQPLIKGDSYVKQRIRTTYKIDDKEMLKVAHKNPMATEIYNYFDNLDEEVRQKILFTGFQQKNVLK